jgi:hypothetical protein
MQGGRQFGEPANNKEKAELAGLVQEWMSLLGEMGWVNETTTMQGLSGFFELNWQYTRG